MLAILVESGGAYALKFTTGEGRLENVGCINSPFGGTGTNEGMDLINDKNHIAGTSNFLHDLLKALFEFAPVFCASHQQTYVQGQDPLVLKDVRHFAHGDALGQAFGDGRLANSRFTDQDRVVLGATTENLDHPLNLVLTPHHRIKFGLGGHLGQVAAKFIQGWRFGRSLAAAA